MEKDTRSSEQREADYQRSLRDFELHHWWFTGEPRCPEGLFWDEYQEGLETEREIAAFIGPRKPYYGGEIPF
jgi:hypothetical protein